MGLQFPRTGIPRTESVCQTLVRGPAIVFGGIQLTSTGSGGGTRIRVQAQFWVGLHLLMLVWRRLMLV